MKSILSLLIVFALPLTANAIIVEDVTQMTFLKPACKFCAGGVDVTTTTVHFSNVSCANFGNGNFELNVEEQLQGLNSSAEQVVSVQLKGQVADCFGPTRKYDYSLSTDKLLPGQRYIIGNPSVLKASPEQF